jgi:hypothetical protein
LGRQRVSYQLARSRGEFFGCFLGGCNQKLTRSSHFCLEVGEGGNFDGITAGYAWIGLVLIVAVAVFVADLIGNMISFKNRVMNALTTAGVSAVAFGLLVYFLYGTVMLTS